MCERHTTLAFARIIAGARPAVCGSCRTTTSPGRTTASRSSAFGRSVAS
jgi:hypothetical protein